MKQTSVPLLLLLIWALLAGCTAVSLGSRLIAGWEWAGPGQGA